MKKTENLFSLIKARFPYWFTVTENFAKNSYYMTFNDPNGILDHVYFTAEWAMKGPVEGLANMLVANVYTKHPSLIPKTNSLIEEKKIEVVIGPDLTKFNNSFQLIGTHMQEMAKIMDAEWDKAFTALKPSIEAMAKLAAEYELTSSDKVADYALKHEGMKSRHNCPQQGCHWKKYTLERLIIHLNDTHKWKRESIADWLDTLDEQPVFYPALEGAE